MAKAEGNLAKARDAYEKLLDIVLALSRADPTSAQHKHGLSVAYYSLGHVARAEGDLPQARKHLGQAVAIQKKLVEQDPTNAMMRAVLVESHVQMAAWSLQDGSMGSLHEHVEAAKALLSWFDKHGRLATDPGLARLRARVEVLLDASSRSSAR